MPERSSASRGPVSLSGAQRPGALDSAPPGNVDTTCCCPLCKRGRLHPNRNQKKRPGTSFLAFVYPDRDDSACQSCRCLARSNCKGEKLQDIVKTLNESDENQEAWVIAVEAWEDAYEDTGKDGRVRNAQAKFRTPTVVKAKQSNMNMDELILGIFWPDYVYSREKGVKLKDDQMVHKTFRGKAYRGIVLPESEGLPIGVIRMTDKEEKGLEQESTLADSETTFYQHGAKRAQQRALQGVAREAHVQTDATGNQSTKVLGGKKLLKRSSTDSSDADWLKMLSGSSAEKKKGKSDKQSKAERLEEEDPDGAPQSADRGRAKSSKPKGSPKVEEQSVSKRRRIVMDAENHVYPSVQQREINTSKTVVSTCEVMVGLAANSQGLKALTVQKIEAQLLRTNKRLEPDMIRKQVYLANPEVQDIAGGQQGDDVDSEMGNSGKEVVGLLKLNRAKLEALKDLAAGLQNATGKDCGKAFQSSPAFLHQGILECRSLGVTVSTYAETMLLLRQATLLFDKDRPAAVLPVLTDKQTKDVFGIVILETDDLKGKAQLTIITHLFAMLYKGIEDHDDDELLTSWLTAMSSFEWVRGLWTTLESF